MAPLSFNNALGYCNEKEGIIAEPTNSLVQSTLESLVGDASYWIGATDIDFEGNFVWMSGTPWSYENWKSGQPNNYGSGEDCATLGGGGEGGEWMDRGCEQKFLPLCQWGGTISTTTTGTTTPPGG